ncbi:MAG: response regulator transcription factor [Rubrivivax sp.]|nr:response regulator transcription factor [Rubrivivax sp.]
MQVLLIDDHEIVRAGTQRLLERIAAELHPGTALDFAAVRDVAAALALPATGVELVLLDYHLPGTSGVEALRAVRAHFEGASVCLLSAETTPQRVREVIEAGASGFIPKTYALDEIEAALRVVLRHRVYLPAELLLAEPAAAPEPDSAPREQLAHFVANELSQRQRQVLALAVRGLPTKLIARQLAIAEGTVKVHLSMVYRALGARNRTDALYRVLAADAAEALDQA